MMRLMSLKQYMQMSKPALIRKITKTLKGMPKKRLAMVCYNITKSKLPTLRSIAIKRRRKARRTIGLTFDPKAEPRQVESDIELEKQFRRMNPEYYRKKRKTKRKFSAKQLAAQRLFAKRARAGTLKRRRR